MNLAKRYHQVDQILAKLHEAEGLQDFSDKQVMLLRQIASDLQSAALDVTGDAIQATERAKQRHAGVE